MALFTRTPIFKTQILTVSFWWIDDCDLNRQLLKNKSSQKIRAIFRSLSMGHYLVDNLQTRCCTGKHRLRDLIKRNKVELLFISLKMIWTLFWSKFNFVYFFISIQIIKDKTLYNKPLSPIWLNVACYTDKVNKRL